MDHPTALRRLAELAALHGVTGYTFAINSRLSITLGRCFVRRQRIELSAQLLHFGDDLIEQTMLHEIAHALAKCRGHGFAWRSHAARIGVRDLSPKCGAIEPGDVCRYSATCACEGRRHGLSRLLKNRTYRCRNCQTPLVWQRRGA